MRIAIVHSFYRTGMPSGENQVVLQQADALTKAGHDVYLVARDSDKQMHEALYRVRSAFRVATGQGASPLNELRRIRPDVTHVHNLFPNFGDSWVNDWTGPLVTTLHNFRSVCANGLLFRDGHYCDDCPTGTSWASLTHRCYRDSLRSTLPLAIATARGLSGNRLVRRSDAVIVLSEAASSRFISFGLEGARCHVIPNGVGVPQPEDGFPSSTAHRAVVIGRLSEEKGVLGLISQWPTGLPLDVIGDGPEIEGIRSIASSNVKVLGRLSHETVMRSLGKASMLVVPSVSLEMQPTVVAEALGSGVPVVARVGNGAADTVRAFGCGAVYSDESLTDALRLVFEGGDALRALSLQTYRENFALDVWVDRLVKLYTSVAFPAAESGVA